MELGNAFRVLGIVLVTGVVGTICFFCLLLFNLFSAEKIESKEKITPTIKLEINNNRIDTIYIYKVK